MRTKGRCTSSLRAVSRPLPHGRGSHERPFAKSSSFFRSIPRLITLTLLPTLLGCAARAPSYLFVEQAERLHTVALAPAVTQDRDLTEYVQLVGARLIKAAEAEVPDKAGTFPDVKFHLVYSPVVNAVAAGGPHVYVYTGLFRVCATEEELAAAMAHAYAHAICLHVEDAGQKPAPKTPLALVMWQYIQSRFTPRQEDEADELAFRLYRRAGWNPDQFEFLFQKLGDAYPAAAPGRTPLRSRAQTARAHSGDASRDQRQLPVADPRTFRALRDQAAGLERTTPPGLATDIFLLAFPNCILSADLPEQAVAQERLRPKPPEAQRVEPN